MFLLVLRWLRALALALWLGGLTTIGAIVAPVSFRLAHLTTRQAGDVVGQSLRVMNVVGLVCGLLLVGVELCFLTLLPARRLTRFSLAVLLAALALTLYLTLALFPEIDAARDVNPIRFDVLHKLDVNLTGVLLLLLIAVAGLDAAREGVGKTASGIIESDANERG